MKKGKDSVGKAIDFMQHLGITNEHLKEHLLTLCMDKKTVEAFEDLDSQLKAAFTREYNKQHKDDVPKGAKGKKKAAPATSLSDNEEEEEVAGEALITEE